MWGFNRNSRSEVGVVGEDSCPGGTIGGPWRPGERPRTASVNVVPAFGLSYAAEPLPRASVAVAVGQSAATPGSESATPLPFTCPGPPFGPSELLGVGQSAALVRKSCPPSPCSPGPLVSLVRGVAQHEAPRASVRRPNIGRPYSRPLRIEPERDKTSKQSPEPISSERCDVLHEDVAGSHDADDGEEGVHEVSLVVASPLLASDAVWLAGYAAADEIHATSEVGSGELVEITREDRGRIQGLVFHPCHEDGRRVAVPLTETHQAGSGESELDAALEPADPGAHAEDAG